MKTNKESRTITGCIKAGVFFALLSFLFITLFSFTSFAEELYPPLDADLNNFDPTVPIGRYIQKVSSNEVVRAVTLTNGVLTVGGESINVAEPTHSVVVTNIVDGQVVVTTNKYDAVYQDGLDKTLKDYAKLKKVTSITTNTVSGVVTTNWIEVAYLDDIPSDSQKADKVIQVYDYVIQDVNVILPRRLDKEAPFAAWGFEGETNGFRNVLLTYTNGVWNISINGESSYSVEGTADASTIQFPQFAHTLVKTNDTRYAFVVYTDVLEEEFNKRMSDIVAKTNLMGIAARIEEDKLNTIGGIQEIFRGIRSEIYSILPAGYRRLNYIESYQTNAGNYNEARKKIQYIDTGYKHNGTTLVQMHIVFTQVSYPSIPNIQTGNYAVYYGARYMVGESTPFSFAGWLKDGTFCRNTTGIGSAQNGERAETNIEYNIVLDKWGDSYATWGNEERYVFSQGNGSTDGDGTPQYQGQYLTDFIFALNQPDAPYIPNWSCRMRLYSCKIYDRKDKNGNTINQYVLRRDFIPVLRESDSAVGLYDLVEGKFYSNANKSGNFVPGY